MISLTLIFPIATILFIGFVFIKGYISVLPECGVGHDSGHEDGISRRDAAAMLIITLCYAAVAFAGLGNISSPVSEYRFHGGESCLIELESPTAISKIRYFTSLHTGSYSLELSSDGENWISQPDMEQKYSDLFKWKDAELKENNGPVRYIRISAQDELWLSEIAVYDADGGMIPTDDMDVSGAEALFDEQELVPEKSNYKNSTYFDEIYHARTAYENIENVYPYEVSHPPLGKIIISLGIRLFGMTPFGWRFMGTLFGAAMLPALYIFIKKLFGSTEISVCGTLIFAFDFMHYTQTRIATIDTYGVFFTILMYLFMYLYLRAERGKDAPRGNWLRWLALSGLCFGLGAASKWTCIYAGAGLGVLWLFDRIERAVDAVKRAKDDENPDGTAVSEYLSETCENVLWCILFFVLVPAAVYYCSYYPYGKASGLSGTGMFFSRDYLDIVLENQHFMLTYHQGVHSSHPYSSSWYQWILDIRPILYYLEYFDDGTRSSIGAFVNPMLCWGGLAAVLSMVFCVLKYRDKKAAFILIGYLAQLIPWVFISRTLFEYHYFQSTVFLLLALCHVFTTVKNHNHRGRAYIYSFTALSILLFAMFYPVLSGIRIPGSYGTHFLKWMDGFWPF